MNFPLFSDEKNALFYCAPPLFMRNHWVLNRCCPKGLVFILGENYKYGAPDGAKEL
jgi:hypothetical protein